MLKISPKYLILFLIKLYQQTLSLDHGPLKFLKPFGQCKFYPTCSDYACQAIQHYGLIKGSWLAIKRLTKCHPWSKGGYDSVTTFYPERVQD